MHRAQVVIHAVTMNHEHRVLRTSTAATAQTSHRGWLCEGPQEPELGRSHPGPVSGQRDEDNLRFVDTGDDALYLTAIRIAHTPKLADLGSVRRHQFHTQGSKVGFLLSLDAN